MPRWPIWSLSRFNSDNIRKGVTAVTFFRCPVVIKTHQGGPSRVPRMQTNDTADVMLLTGFWGVDDIAILIHLVLATTGRDEPDVRDSTDLQTALLVTPAGTHTVEGHIRYATVVVKDRTPVLASRDAGSSDRSWKTYLPHDFLVVLELTGVVVRNNHQAHWCWTT